MRKYLIPLLLLLSCVENRKTLPSSTGANSEIIFVVDDALWKKSVYSVVNEVFGKSIEGISQNENLFRIIQVNHREFKTILKTHKNIIIISKEVNDSSQKNKWANGQFVAQFFCSSNTNKLKERLVRARSIFILKEINAIKNSFAITSQKTTEKNLFNNFGIECIIPQEYKIHKNDSVIFWANYNPQKSDEIKNILTFSFTPKSVNLQKEVLQKIDSISAKYLLGEKQGSYVRIEPQYPPFYFENTYRGLWKLEKGFMGGPFIAKTYFIEEKVVVNAGFIFAPDSRKRKYIKELEAIL